MSLVEVVCIIRSPLHLKGYITEIKVKARGISTALPTFGIYIIYSQPPFWFLALAPNGSEREIYLATVTRRETLKRTAKLKKTSNETCTMALMATRTKLPRLLSSGSRSPLSGRLGAMRSSTSAAPVESRPVGLGMLGLKDYEDYRRSLYGEITHKALLVDAAGTLLVPSQPMAQVCLSLSHSQTHVLYVCRDALAFFFHVWDFWVCGSLCACVGCLGFWVFFVVEQWIGLLGSKWTFVWVQLNGFLGFHGFSLFFSFVWSIFYEFCLVDLTSLSFSLCMLCYRFTGRLGRSMGWSSQRMWYWTDTEGLIASLGVDLVSGLFQFFSPLSIFVLGYLVVNYVFLNTHFLYLFSLWFYFFILYLSWIFCLIFPSFFYLFIFSIYSTIFAASDWKVFFFFFFSLSFSDKALMQSNKWIKLVIMT